MSWYAHDIAHYIRSCISRLMKDPETRKAIAYIGTDRFRDDDATCTTTIQFLIRSNTLYTIVTMRSWDLYLGAPYDISMFSLLSKAVRSRLNIPQGVLYIKPGSAHIYEHSYKSHEWDYKPTYPVPENFPTWVQAQEWAMSELKRIKNA